MIEKFSQGIEILMVEVFLRSQVRLRQYCSVSVNSRFLEREILARNDH